MILLLLISHLTPCLNEYVPILETDPDPCPLLEQVHTFQPKLPKSASAYLTKAAHGFDPTRRLSVQHRLFRDDLVWQGRGFSDKQLDLMVFITVGLSLELADGQLTELKEKYQKSGNPEDLLKMDKVRIYCIDAVNLLDRLSPKLKDLPLASLRIYF